jgi:xanthine phosphoribosyltransferase
MTAPLTAQRSLPVSWEALHRDARELARRVAAAGPFSGVVAIARGGLVPAAIVARELEIRTVTQCRDLGKLRGPDKQT